MQITLTTATGKKSTSKITLPEFFNKELNKALVHQVVVSYQANARQATKKQKTRGEVSGGGKKPWRQKGTGRARAGTSSSPIWRGGGVTFAARANRNYSQKVNRKMYRAAMENILSEIHRQGALIVVDRFDMDTISTKDLLKNITPFQAKNLLLVTDEVSLELYLSGRNVYTISILDVSAVNPVDLINHDKVLFTKKALSIYNKVEAAS